MKVFPVVHINDVEVATEQALLAREAGADGVYLIDHGGGDFDPAYRYHPDKRLFDTFNAVNQAAPDMFIGVNLLGPRPLNAMMELAEAHDTGRLDRIPDGLWSDDGKDELQPGETEAYRQREPALQSMRYLGGVAFKYTNSYTEDPRKAAAEVQRMRERVNVVVTSGAGTGQAAPVEKLQAMKAALGDAPLAVASGVDINNIASYAGVVDEVLVATSVETEPYSGIFNPEKLRALIQAAHEIDARA